MTVTPKARWRDFLPEAQPKTVEGALVALGIDYIDRRHDHDYRPTQYMARCPFPDHRDRRPSFSIQSESGLWFCFGCGRGGNLAQLVTKITRAPKFLAERWLSYVVYEPCRPYRPEPEFSYRDEAWYARTFPSPPAWALDERGIDRAVADELGIRWYDEDDCWILPIRHPDDFKLIGWQVKAQGRKFIKTLEGTPKGMTLFGIELLLQPGTPAIVVEDALDAAVIMSATDYGGVVATFGVSISDEQLRLLATRASEILIAFDNDEAGAQGLARIRDSKHMTGKRLFEFNYFDVAWKSKDPGEMSDAQIKRAIRQAKTISRR
jgi:hypothetical protein